MKKILLLFLAIHSSTTIAMNNYNQPLAVIPMQQMLFVVAVANVPQIEPQRPTPKKNHYKQPAKQPKNKPLMKNKKNYPVQQPFPKRKGHR